MDFSYKNDMGISGSLFRLSNSHLYSLLKKYQSVGQGNYGNFITSYDFIRIFTIVFSYAQI